MAYSYQQNVYEGASYGYVQYNISPDIGTPISAGTTVTITGKAYLKNSASKSLQLCIYRTGAYKYAFVNLSIPKATATDFTLQFQMWQLDANWGSGRVFQVPFDFTFWTAANCEGDGNTTVAVDAQKLSYLTYRISPAARVVLFDRYSASGSGYVKNDEGTLVMGSLAISLATGRSVSDITVASVAITGDDGSSKSLTLSQTVLTAALSSEGYTESAPGLFASMSFNTANNYTITFTIGDAYDKAVFSVLIARSFANMHLSGVPTGGVAFGKFSSAQPDQPLFECAYPIVLIGSAVYGSSSAMPENPVEGQLYFVVE